MRKIIKKELDVLSEISGGGEVTHHKSRVKGIISAEGETVTITYPENSEGGRSITELTFSGETVRLRKRGTVISDIEFTEGATHASVYSVPPYRFDVSVLTHSISTRLPDPDNATQSNVYVRLCYTVTIGGEEQKITMHITSADKD